MAVFPTIFAFVLEHAHFPKLAVHVVQVELLHTAGLLRGAGLFFGGAADAWSGPSRLRLAA